jgi:two-component system LytT family sensor kinase
MRAAVAVLHAGYWILYLLLLASFLVIGRLPGRPGWAVAGALLRSPLVVLAIVPSVVAFYSSYGFLGPRLLARRRLAALAAAAIGLCLATGVLGLVLLYLLFGAAQPVFASGVEMIALALSLSALAAIHATIAVVLRGFVDWYHELKVKEALKQKTHDMELALVRARLDPHFLFNTLNNLDVLIARDPAVASEYLSGLSDIMRFVLYEAKGESIPLASELAYIEKYIALERLRTRRARYATHEVAGQPAGVRIAPMTFIPFIENAFKHTEDRKEDGAIASRIAIHGRFVTFECVNHCAHPPNADAARGIGQELIRQRLALLYPGRHALEAGRQGDRYRVRLTIETADTRQ